MVAHIAGFVQVDSYGRSYMREYQWMLYVDLQFHIAICQFSRVNKGAGQRPLRRLDHSYCV